MTGGISSGGISSGGISSGGILAWGDFVLEGFCLGGFCQGGFCPGGFGPVTVWDILEFIFLEPVKLYDDSPLPAFQQIFYTLYKLIHNWSYNQVSKIF